ncbi:hypothetical protein BDFB_013394 [Asbolus verrucosus]|uniref:Uncharacterized protein n=1 Tax=Asbolus verrucosus TaxID=1661398 RepID=A0A482W4D7_ASBVE|nr:hypothetical protein BDFB_013394 [Asbolus verrucosus]
MVRKRSRKYESDDNDSDSDLDFTLDQGQAPAPKKYSLRERKRAPLFTTDFDYYGLDDDEGEPKKHSSDDEDFEVEADVETTRSYYEPESGPQNSEGLIDFEDIIRADIVVNKNKIDYDNLIQKSEIKLTQPKRRGRKPKNQVQVQHHEESINPDYTCEPDIQTLTHLENQDSQENKEILQPEINFCEGQDGLPNGDSFENLEHGDSDKLVNNETDPLAMKNANNIETVILKPPPIEENIFKEDEPKAVEDEDDDVIVLGELKQDVIVLDD